MCSRLSLPSHRPKVMSSFKVEAGLRKYAIVMLIMGLFAAPIFDIYGVLVSFACFVLLCTIIVYFVSRDLVSNNNVDKDKNDLDAIGIVTYENAQTRSFIAPIVNVSECRPVPDCPKVPSNQNHLFIHPIRNSLAQPYHRNSTSMLFLSPPLGNSSANTISLIVGASSSIPKKADKKITILEDSSTKSGKNPPSFSCRGIQSGPLVNIASPSNPPISYSRESSLPLKEKEMTCNLVPPTLSESLRPLRKRKRAQQAENDNLKARENGSEVEYNEGKCAQARTVESETSGEIPRKRLKEDKDDANKSKTEPKSLAITKPQRFCKEKTSGIHCKIHDNQPEVVNRFKNLPEQTDYKKPNTDTLVVHPSHLLENVEKEDVNMLDVESSDENAAIAQTPSKIGIMTPNDGLGTASPPSRSPTPSSCPTPSSYADEPTPSPSPMSMASSSFTMPVLKLS